MVKFELLMSFLIAMTISVGSYAAVFDDSYGKSESSESWGMQLRLAAGEGISLEEAVQRAKRAHNGKVLSADKGIDKGTPVYRIKMIMPDGRVKTVMVDANSGRLL